MLRVLGIGFVDERAERVLGCVLAERADCVLGLVSAERAERVLSFMEKQNRPRKEYHVLNFKASQQYFPFVNEIFTRF